MSLEEFKKLNKEIGNHWFSVGAMHFFDSKIHDFDEDTGVFITSEDSHIGASVRKFTLRHADFQTGRVKTLSVFQEFDSLRCARAEMGRKLVVL